MYLLFSLFSRRNPEFLIWRELWWLETITNFLPWSRILHSRNTVIWIKACSLGSWGCKFRRSSWTCKDAWGQDSRNSTDGGTAIWEIWKMSMLQNSKSRTLGKLNSIQSNLRELLIFFFVCWCWRWQKKKECAMIIKLLMSMITRVKGRASPFLTFIRMLEKQNIVSQLLCTWDYLGKKNFFYLQKILIIPGTENKNYSIKQSSGIEDHDSFDI